MSTDAVELLVAIEERFGIEIDDVAASRVTTVGDLESLVLRRLSPPTSTSCLTLVTFYRLRSVLRRQYGLARSRVRPDAATAELIPLRHRRVAWRALAHALGLRLPELRRTAILENALLAGFIGSIPLAVVGGSLGAIPEHVAWFVGISALPALRLAYRVTKPLAVHLPETCGTVGQATGAILAMNFGRIAAERQSWSNDELRSALRATIVDRLGVAPHEVTREARLVDDLGVDQGSLPGMKFP